MQKCKLTYAVVRSSSGQGFIVQTVYDGWLPSPYTHSQREREVSREKRAKEIADRLNSDPATHSLPDC